MDTKKKLDESCFGSDAAEKINKLTIGLLVIEEKHIKYFEERLPKYSIDKCDKLQNHYITATNQEGITFAFLNKSDLDENIRIECIELFNEIFNSKIKN